MISLYYHLILKYSNREKQNILLTFNHEVRTRMTRVFSILSRHYTSDKVERQTAERGD